MNYMVIWCKKNEIISDFSMQNYIKKILHRFLN
jgi:hypothetical protein